MNDQQTLPRDAFSEALRAFEKNPGATRHETTIHRVDFLGRSETWILVTYTADGAATTLIQRIGADGQAIREVLPPEITSALQRHRSNATKANRKRGARQAVATKLAAGMQVGNVEALRAARGKPRTRRKSRRRGGRIGHAK